MFLLNHGLILLMISCIKADFWKIPTATDIQISLETCQITDLLFLNVWSFDRTYVNISPDKSDIKCFTGELGLWSDEEGFKAQRFVQLLSKHKQPNEIYVVVNYCNKRHKQNDLNKWANEAFDCFAGESIGPWINDYVKSVYKKKGNK